MINQKYGSAELAEIKKVDVALKKREDELETLNRAREKAQSGWEYVTNNKGVPIQFSPEDYKAMIAALDAKIDKINARIEYLKELRPQLLIVHGNAVMPNWWEWGKWNPDIGDDGVKS